MNRAERRFAQLRRRPSGAFVGELQRRGDQDAYQAVMRDLIQQEANGRPFDPETRARMTKPKSGDELWQVMVTDREKGLVPMGPMMNKDACGLMAEAVNRQIATVGRRDWTKAEIYPMTPIATGVN